MKPTSSAQEFDLATRPEYDTGRRGEPTCRPAQDVGTATERLAEHSGQRHRVWPVFVVRRGLAGELVVASAGAVQREDNRLDRAARARSACRRACSPANVARPAGTGRPDPRAAEAVRRRSDSPAPVAVGGRLRLAALAARPASTREGRDPQPPRAEGATASPVQTPATLPRQPAAGCRTSNDDDTAAELGRRRGLRTQKLGPTGGRKRRLSPRGL
jgi:hypothetical protein